MNQPIQRAPVGLRPSCQRHGPYEGPYVGDVISPLQGDACGYMGRLNFSAWTKLEMPRPLTPTTRLVVARPCPAVRRGEYAQPSSASDGVGTCTRVLRQLTSPKVSEWSERSERSELFGATPAQSSTGHPARREGQAFRTPVPSRARPCRHATCPFSLVCVSASIDEAERRREFTPLHSLVK